MNTVIHLQMLAISLLSLICLSCQWLNGVANPAPPELIWKMTLTTGEDVEGEIPLITSDSGVLAIGSDKTLPILYFFDRNTGKILWKWQEFFKRDEFVLVYGVYKYHNIAIINNSPIIYAIDLSSGKTIWTQSQPEREKAWVHGLGNLFFGATGFNQVSIGNTLSGTYRTIAVNSPKVSFVPPSVYIDFKTQDTLLIMPGTNTVQDSTSQFYFKNYLASYNMTKQRLEYQTLMREGYATPQTGLGGTGRECIIYDSKVFINLGRSIQCRNIMTGNLVWKRTFTSNFFIANLLQAEGKIIGNGDDDGVMYALDPNQGNIIWESKTTTAAGSQLFYMNGIIYMTGSGDGRLYAIDVKTGKQLWKLQCPDENGTRSSFTGTVTGDKDRVYVNSYRNLYCYKAAK